MSLEDRIRDLKARIDAVPRVKAGDYVTHKLHNQIIDFLREAADILEELSAIPPPIEVVATPVAGLVLLTTGASVDAPSPSPKPVLLTSGASLNAPQTSVSLEATSSA